MDSTYGALVWARGRPIRTTPTLTLKYPLLTQICEAKSQCKYDRQSYMYERRTMCLPTLARATCTVADRFVLQIGSLHNRDRARRYCHREHIRLCQNHRFRSSNRQLHECCLACSRTMTTSMLQGVSSWNYMVGFETLSARVYAPCIHICLLVPQLETCTRTGIHVSNYSSCLCLQEQQIFVLPCCVDGTR